ncbi:hypothetical protein CCR75_005366 [Bremia lactucae]|uniref:[phosphatase 2A protein]-leucine-carboxy methyltransferase n=1 Tax=Bremia lactucae TaxID=4779 RepID=A0A976FFC2_BRELC|nr:hypothetical protein CCR75_005366 [Bremia lactucae]
MTQAPNKRWRGTSDHNVTETAYDAIKCKLSAAKLGYFEDPFLHYFVARPTRRLPLIHRGYYLRHVAMTRCIELFLTQFKTSTHINIVSLGAGFDTLFFRLLHQRSFAGHIAFAEVDCDAIVCVKTKLLNDDNVRVGLFPNNLKNLVIATPVHSNVSWQCHVPSASYSLIACDLGDTQLFDTTFTATGADRSVPTLILAECVVSYLAPEHGTELLQYLSTTFSRGSIVLYDPIALKASDKDDSEAFSSTLQDYFAIKGCTLRGVREFQTAVDHARRFLASAQWQNCRILDMNSVFATCTTIEEKRRITSLEPFDEFADWVLCNAHYALILADNRKCDDKGEQEWTNAFVPSTHQHRYLLTGTCIRLSKASDNVIIRAFQPEDLAAVRAVFEITHLEFGKDSRAVRQFVANRLRGPCGDMFDVTQAFQTPTSAGIQISGFWVAEWNQKVVGCVGVKPLNRSSITQDDEWSAELCRLSVTQAVRRRGVATALIKGAETFAVSCGAFDKICLETIGTMKGSQQLYCSLGYVEQLDRQKQHSSFNLVCFHKTL